MIKLGGESICQWAIALSPFFQRFGDRSDEMTGVRESAIIAASNVLSCASSVIVPAWAQDKHLRTQVCDLAIDFFTNTSPVTLHMHGPHYYALSEEDRWHFFDRQLHITSKPDGSFTSPFSRSQVEGMIDAYLKSALQRGWEESGLEHVFGCRNIDAENASFFERPAYGNIRDSHEYLITHIQSRPDLGIRIPEDYLTFKKAYIPMPKTEMKLRAAVTLASTNLAQRTARADQKDT
jgi:hypothetical protein